MVEKAFLVEPHRKAVTLVRHPSIMVVIGVGAFLLFIGETVGTAQELPTGTIGLSGRASIERPGFRAISYPAAATHNGQATASPGQWLIDDVARERAEFELRQISPMPLSATNARDAAHVEAGVGLPSSAERRAREVGIKSSEPGGGSTGGPKVPKIKISTRPLPAVKRRAASRPPFKQALLQDRNTSACTGSQSCSGGVRPLFGVGP
jgi:hypothetical protein